MSFDRRVTRNQKEALSSDWSYDDGGRYSLLVVSGFEIGTEYDTFGAVFALIDCDTGEQIETSRTVPSSEMDREWRLWVRRVRELNGKQDAA